MLTDKIILAHEKAEEWHFGQKYGELPYYDSHILEVYNLVYDKVEKFPVGYMELCLIVALLHDVLEDTDVKSSELAILFGIPATLAVECLTDGAGMNRKERKLKSYHRIRSNEVTVLVKVADRLANMRNCMKTNNNDLLKMYVKEYDSFYAGLWSPYHYFQDWWDELNKIVDKSLTKNSR